MNRLWSRSFLFSLIILLAGLACNLPGYPQAPIPALTPSAGDAAAFEQAFRQAADQARQGGTFQISVTQGQLSSWIALRGPEIARSQGIQWPLRDAQVGLNDGKIALYGILVQQGVPETAVQVVLRPSINAAGGLSIAVESGQFGIASVPADVLNNLNTTLQNALNNQLAQIQAHYRLTGLSIANGALTLTGQIVP